MVISKVEGIYGLGVFFYKDEEEKSRNIMITIIDLTIRINFDGKGDE